MAPRPTYRILTLDVPVADHDELTSVGKKPNKPAQGSWEETVARDVHEGRKNLNFSTWNRLATKEQIKAFHESWETVEEGEMPLWFYLPTHPDARLSSQDRSVLRAWSLAMGGADSKEH
jgi:hypothetical protein